MVIGQETKTPTGYETDNSFWIAKPNYQRKIHGRAVILDIIRHDTNIKNPYLKYKIPKDKIKN